MYTEFAPHAKMYCESCKFCIVPARNAPLKSDENLIVS